MFPDDREWAETAEREEVKTNTIHTLPVNTPPVNTPISKSDNTMRYKLSHPRSLCMMRAIIYPLQLSAQNASVPLWNIDHLQPDSVCVRRVSSYTFVASPVIYHNQDSQLGPITSLSVREAVLYMADLAGNGDRDSRYPWKLKIVW